MDNWPVLMDLVLWQNGCVMERPIVQTTGMKRTVVSIEKAYCLFDGVSNFNNILVISWRSVLLVEETWVPAEKLRPVASHWQTLLYNVVWSYSMTGWEKCYLLIQVTECCYYHQLYNLDKQLPKTQVCKLAALWWSRETLSYNDVHLTLIEIQTHNISGDSH